MLIHSPIPYMTINDYSLFSYLLFDDLVFIVVRQTEENFHELPPRYLLT